MNVFRRFLAGDLDDESLHVVLVPKQPRRLRVMPARCENPDCRTCNGEAS